MQQVCIIDVLKTRLLLIYCIPRWSWDDKIRSYPSRSCYKHYGSKNFFYIITVWKHTFSLRKIMLIYFQTCIIIQEIFAEGVVAKDARLRVGDQILEVYFKIIKNAENYSFSQLYSRLIWRMTHYCVVSYLHYYAKSTVMIFLRDFPEIQMISKKIENLGEIFPHYLW